MKAYLSSILAILLSSISTYAQDIDTFNISTNTQYPSSTPDLLYSDGDTLYFSANDQIYGRELWQLRPYDTFPQRITDIIPLGASSLKAEGKSICKMDSTLYFSARDTADNYELWSLKNGVVKKVKEIYPGIEGSDPNHMIVYEGRLYFSAKSPNYGYELHSYDPILDTVMMVYDLAPGSASSNPQNLTLGNYRRLYLTADDGALGRELYTYSFLDTQIHLIADLMPGSQSGVYGLIVSTGVTLYLVGRQPHCGWEMFYSYQLSGFHIYQRSDLNTGTANGINPVLTNTEHQHMVYFKYGIYYEGYDRNSGAYHLIRGNENNINQIIFPTNPNGNSEVGEVVVYNYKIFFTATDGVHGKELWFTDGVNPPQMAADVLQGSMGSNPRNLTVANGYLYFTADVQGSIGEELFRLEDKTLSVTAVGKTKQLRLYPNPSTGSITIDLGNTPYKSGTISVYDMSGKVIYQQPLSSNTQQITLTLPNIPSGVYQVYAIVDGVAHTAKLTIE